MKQDSTHPTRNIAGEQATHLNIEGEMIENDTWARHDSHSRGGEQGDEATYSAEAHLVLDDERRNIIAGTV